VVPTIVVKRRNTSTHDSNDPEKNHVACGLASAYSVRALRVGQYVDQSSSHGLEKFCEDIPISPKVVRTNTLNCRPNFKFSRSRVFGGPLSPFKSALSKLGQSLARIKI